MAAQVSVRSNLDGFRLLSESDPVDHLILQVFAEEIDKVAKTDSDYLANRIAHEVSKLLPKKK